MSIGAVSCLAMTEIPGRSHQNRRGTAALVLACMSLVLSLIACGVTAFAAQGDSGKGSDRLPLQSEPVAASAAHVEAVALVILPPGTVSLSAAYSSGLETRLSAKFRLPRSELDGFITSARFTAALTPGLAR